MHMSVAVAAFALGLSTASFAETALNVLPLREAARLAVERQPGLEAYDYAAAAAREAAVAEGEMPDPLVSLGAQSVPITGSDSLSFTQEDMTMTTIGVMQEMVRPEKRQAAANRMQAESEQWMLERAAQAREVARDAKLAWIDAYEAARQVVLYERLAEELSAERKVASQRISSGAAQATDVFQLDSMLAGINDRRIAARSGAQRARARLARWLGDAAFRPLPVALTHADSGSVEQMTSSEAVLEDHPQLAVRRKAIDVARFEADRARAERKADWSWQVMYGHRQADRSDMVSVQIAMPLQINRAQRQDRRVAEKLALVERMRAMTIDRERELHADFLAVQADVEAARARLREYRERLAPAAQARLQSASAGYASGASSLATLWEARRAVVEADLQYAMIESEMLRAEARYAYLAGETQ